MEDLDAQLKALLREREAMTQRLAQAETGLSDALRANERLVVRLMDGGVSAGEVSELLSGGGAQGAPPCVPTPQPPPPHVPIHHVAPSAAAVPVATVLAAPPAPAPAPARSPPPASRLRRAGSSFLNLPSVGSLASLLNLEKAHEPTPAKAAPDQQGGQALPHAPSQENNFMARLNFVPSISDFFASRAAA